MLLFRLKKVWFDKILVGEKTHEYRESKPSWDKKIYNAILKGIKDEDAKEVEKWFLKCSIFCEKKSDFAIPVSIPICFTSGYPASNNKNRIIYAKAKTIRLLTRKIDCINTDLGSENPTYDIEFKILNYDDWKIFNENYNNSLSQ